MNFISGFGDTKKAFAKKTLEKILQTMCPLIQDELKKVNISIRKGDIACIVREGLFSKKSIDDFMESGCVKQLSDRVTANPNVDPAKFNTAIKAILQNTRKAKSAILAIGGLTDDDVTELVANNCETFKS